MRVTTEGKAMGSSKGQWWLDDRRSSQAYKRDWIDHKTASLIKDGHTKQFARAKAKTLYRELSR